MKRFRAAIACIAVLYFIPATVVWSQPLPPGIGGGAPIFPSGMPPSGLTPPPTSSPNGIPPPPSNQGGQGGENSSSVQGGGSDKLILLNFRDSPLDQVLEFVADLLGRTMIKSPGINATVTLKSQTRLTVPEALQAIEAVLAMNNVTLVPMGEKFLKVVQTGQARQEGMSIGFESPKDKDKFNEDDKLISQVITLKYMEIAEIQPIIQSLIHGYGKIQALERTNSMLITDTAANLKRIMEILDYIDQPTESKVETRIYEIHYAEAGKIASKINELIADTQAKEDKPRIEQAATPAAPAIPSPPGVIRARMPGAAAESSSEVESALQLAERGIVRGKVKIIADDRTNILFVLSRIENFAFFDKIVAVLDRPVEPEITVRVVALEYAKAEEISGILNEFIGAATSDQNKTPAGAAPATTTPGQAPNPAQAAADARSQSIRDFIQQRVEQRPQEAGATEGEKGALGRLSSNTKILADKRTNSLLLMGKKSDLDALEEIVNNLDTMLAQVLIETVIIEVNLGKGLQYGVDWLQRAVVAYNETTEGPNGGLTVRDPVYAFAGASLPGGEVRNRLIDASSVDRNNLPASAGGLTYFLTYFDLNLDAVLHLAANSRDARILSTPVILTTDNTEAKINVGEQRPIVTSSSTTDTGTQTQNFEYKNIGIQLTVTPRINPQRFVVLEINQTADNVNGSETINGNLVPIITKREMAAQIAVKSRSTIVLGGLVATSKEKSRAKVPFLGDIPLLGVFFRSDTLTDARTELLVLITPYVLTTPEEARAETARLHNSTFSSKTRWPRGWTDSPLSRGPVNNAGTPESVEAPLPAKSRDIFHNNPAGDSGKQSSGSIELNEWKEVKKEDTGTAEPATAKPEQVEEQKPAAEAPAAEETAPAPAAEPLDPNAPVPMD